MPTEIDIELQAPPVKHAILVLQGRPMSQERVANMKVQLEEALRENKWPIILNHDGPVYWLPSRPPGESA